MKRIKTMAKNEDYAHLFDKCQIFLGTTSKVNENALKN